VRDFSLQILDPNASDLPKGYDFVSAAFFGCFWLNGAYGSQNIISTFRGRTPNWSFVSVTG
jgi:hypothetical protein